MKFTIFKFTLMLIWSSYLKRLSLTQDHCLYKAQLNGAERYLKDRYLSAPFKQCLSGLEIETRKQRVIKIIKDCGLKITIKVNLKIVNSLDVTFNLPKNT